MVGRFCFFHSASPPGWGLISKTTPIRRSKTLSLSMYVIGLACDCCAFDEDMVLSSTRLNLSALENASYFSFTVKHLVSVSGGRRKEEML